MIDTSVVSDFESAQVTGLGKGQFVLQVCGGKFDGRIVRLSSQKCSIGSGTGCTLRLCGAEIDPLHCLILRGERGAFVRRWSSNTRLNGQPFADAQLKVGDRLSVGPVELEVLENAPAEPTHDGTNSYDNEYANGSELTKLQESLTSSRLTSKNRLRKVIGELRSTRHRLNDFEAGSAQNSQEVGLLNERIEQLQSELTGLESQCESHEQQRADWQQQQSHLQEQLDVQNKQLEMLNSATEKEGEQQADDSWHEEKQQLEEQLAQLRREARDHNKLAEELEEKETKLTGALEQASQLRQRLEDIERNRCRQSTRESEIRKSESLLDERAKGIDAANVRLNQEREILEESHGRLEAERRLVDEREAKLEEREATLLQQTQKLEAAVASLEQKPLHLEVEEPTCEHQSDEQYNEEPQEAPELSHDETLSVPQVNQTIRLQPEDQPASNESAHSDSEVNLNQTMRLPVGETTQANFLVSEPEAELEAEAVATESEEEELSFQQTEDVAPLSTADVLARMGHVPDFPEEEGQAEVDPTDRPERRQAPRPSQDEVEYHSKDDSIENYMARLLQRVRGEDTIILPAANKQSVHPARKTENDSANESPASDAVEPEAMKEENFIPRRQAPEWSKDLSAMRELANQTARSAIETSDSLRKRSEVMDRLLVVIAAAVIGFILLMLSNSVFSVTVLGAIISFGVAIVWTLKVLKIKKQLQEEPEAVEESPEDFAVEELLDGNITAEQGLKV